jgi:hypothetical protein
LVTGEAASRGALTSPDRIGREFTRRLGDPTPLVLGGESYPVTALLGVVLRDVVEQVTKAEGEPPDRVVLTHPTSWGPFRRALFEEATQQAGMTNSLLMTEAEAAVEHYTASRPLSDGETMAVYDLGGGTFDATVLRMHAGSVKIIGKPERIEALGGGNFDEAILSHVNDTADGALAKLDMQRPQTFVALARVRQQCVAAKEALSADTEATFPVFLPSRTFDVHLTRSEFENAVRAPIESTIHTLSRALQSAPPLTPRMRPSRATPSRNAAGSTNGDWSVLAAPPRRPQTVLWVPRRKSKKNKKNKRSSRSYRRSAQPKCCLPERFRHHAHRRMKRRRPPHATCARSQHHPRPSRHLTVSADRGYCSPPARRSRWLQ